MLPDRYNLANLRRALADPWRLRLEAYRVALGVNRRFYDHFGVDGGVDVVERDWDLLVVLDGCRHDFFRELSTLPGDLSAVRSRASDSWGFMAENFLDRDLHDTVYVTANPHARDLPEGTFHALVDLLEDHWDEDLRTVLPGVVAEETLAARERFPDKRVVAHFMQPHFPFVGETGRAFDHMGIDLHLDDDQRELDAHPWFSLVYDPEVDDGTVVEAYRENYEVVLPHVERLLDELDERVVVTADHANLVGERTWPVPVRTFGHPPGFAHPALREVPWLVREGTDRPSVSADPPLERDERDDELVAERLRDLGYVA